ncbi:hypothetical protein K443DRAFT_127299 [Laccaria amethystina LaAM-08-1]|uniref:General transcription and DNA repair factor IIH subunit TFB4 n=1 Tax=Laccaria amethystina LaAM-08-1 TaxID=1095629 RepID=A0A0C9YHX2_9AGAR|nr:hypothetical protein K443DRAFT_127299 [Laccaria amethystina LaAM-08-1]
MDLSDAPQLPDASHLSVVLDLSPTQWHLSGLLSNKYPLSLNSFLSHVLAFLNAHLASQHENTLAVFGAFPAKSLMLYSSTLHNPELQSIDSNSYAPFKLVDSTIINRISDELDAIDHSEEEDAPCALVGALTKALCYVNRISLPPPSNSSTSLNTRDSTVLPDPRILILSVSPDLSTSYIPIMNSIFSAQKLKVTIDACQVYGPDAVFLQQAAHLTGGSYLFLERRDALLQYLIMSFLSAPSIRQILAVPTQDRIDFRAACFCHKNIIDIGFVCSVCLSIFCQPVPVCSTCRTKFPIKTLQRLNASRPNVPSLNKSGPPSVVGTPQSRTPASTDSRRNLPFPGEQPLSTTPGNGNTPATNGSKH